MYNIFEIDINIKKSFKLLYNILLLSLYTFLSFLYVHVQDLKM